MPKHNFDQPRGRLDTLKIASRVLQNNVVGDPTTRTVAVYLPEGYDGSTEEYPLFVALAGFTGSGLKLLSWNAFGESLPQRIDRLIAEGRMGPVVVALPDCFTALGGNQYVNSSALGNWEDFVLDEMLPRLEEQYRVRRDPAARAVFGKSSGGYGALVHGLKHGERWGAVACHSGDMGFDTLYRRDLPVMLDALARFDGDVVRYVEHLQGLAKIGWGEMHALMMLAMAASYDPDPDAPLGLRLPVDPRTCELIEERWACWLAHDPLVLIERNECRQSLRRLNRLFIDCGSRDQFFLHYPARSFARKLERFDIPHTYEEFDDNHSGVDYRLDRSLPLLYEAVCG